MTTFIKDKAGKIHVRASFLDIELVDNSHFSLQNGVARWRVDGFTE